MSPEARQLRNTGILFGLISAATFGTSGTFAKSLLHQGWSPAAIVTLRITGAALILAIPALYAIRGRWHLLRRNLPHAAAYGIVAVAGCQLAYFYAVQRLSVGVALMLEYLGIVFVVAWNWAMHGRKPNWLIAAGMGLSILGLALVLDVFGGVKLDLLGVVFGLLAAVGLAVYFVTAGSSHEDALPGITLAGVGLGLGALTLWVAMAVGLVPWKSSTHSVTLRGTEFPWWLAVLELAAVAAALAYVAGNAAVRRLGSTMASFLGLTEVLFAVLFAWLLLGELPAVIQLVGGVAILAGVIAVRLGENAQAAAAGTQLTTDGSGVNADPAGAQRSAAEVEPDFSAPGFSASDFSEPSPIA